MSLEQPEILKIDGREYKVTGFTDEIQGKFKRFMEDKFLDLVRDNKDSLREDYLPMLNRHFFDVKNGAYKFGGDNFYLFINVEDNFTDLMFAVIQQPGEGMPLTKDKLRAWIQAEPEMAAGLFQRMIDTTKKN